MGVQKSLQLHLSVQQLLIRRVQLEDVSVWELQVNNLWRNLILVQSALVSIYTITQLTFTCSKSTIETLEKGAKYVHSLHQKHQNDVHDVVLAPFSSASIVDFGQMLAGCFVLSLEH